MALTDQPRSIYADANLRRLPAQSTPLTNDTRASITHPYYDGLGLELNWTQSHRRQVPVGPLVDILVDHVAHAHA